MFLELLMISIHTLFALHFSRRMVSFSSDNAFYENYVKECRKKGFFVKQFEQIVNPHNIFDPPLLFFIVSKINEKYIEQVKLLTSALLGLLTNLMVLLLLKSVLGETYETLYFALYLATPLLYSASNSRLYGLSARGLGILLYTIFTLVYYYYSKDESWQLFTVLCVVSILIILSNLFAQQGLIFLGIFLFLFYGKLDVLIIIMTSVLVLFLTKKDYFIPFFKSRIRYSIIYSKYLAKSFILKQRAGVYRDFIWNFWRGEMSISKRVFYIYTNPIVQGIFLTPVIILLLFLTTNFELVHSDYSFFAIISFLSFFLTSLNWFRFLGEPERYIELALPWIIVTTVNLKVSQSWMELYVLCGLIVISIINYSFFKKIRSSKNVSSDAELLYLNNQGLFNSNSVLFSNNQSVLTFLMKTDAKLVFWYPSEASLGGVSIDEVFDSYPVSKQKYTSLLLERFSCSLFIGFGDIDGPPPQFELVDKVGSLVLYAR